MPSKRFLMTAAPFVILALAGMGLATAQSSSPFATNKRAQAWETQAPPTPYQAPYQAPAQTFGQAPYQAPLQSPAPQYKAPQAASPSAPIATNVSRRAGPAPAYRSFSTATPPKTYGGQPAQPYQPQNLAGAPTPPTGSNYNYQPPRQTRIAQAPNYGSPAPRAPSVPPSVPAPQYGAPPPSASSASPYAPQSRQRPQAWEVPQQQAPQTPQAPQQYGAPPQYNSGANVGQYEGGQYNGGQYAPPAYQSSTPPTGLPPQGAPFPGGPYTPPPQQKRSLKDRLGLGDIATMLRGAFTGGAAVSFRDQPENQFGPDDGTSEDFIGDAKLELEVSAITQTGLEYGFVIGGRAQYDPFRRGFGGRTPDCPPTVAGCSGQAFASPTGLRGHTSGFYATGEDIAEDVQGAVESAHLFLRSAYGDVTIGRDDGAAYLFSLGAPSLLAVGASNSPVDYTGYDSVKTVNDASGYAEKITYTSPRLLGDQIGVGVQLGVSYALDADVCGVDYCNGRNIDGVTQPDIEDVFEVGLALDRTFASGLGVELTGTYAAGSEDSGLAGLDDLDSYGAGLEFTYADWTLGGSFLQSNNGLQDGDYTAFDAGLTWKPGALGFTLGYGHAEDDNIGLSSDQATFGVTYEFDKFTLGTGVQYVDREVDGLDAAGALTSLDQQAASVFVQGGFKF